MLEPLMDRLRPGWRERRNQKKSAWHLPKFILWAALFGVLWQWVVFPMIWYSHTFFHPENAALREKFWNTAPPSFLALCSFLAMIFPLGFALMIFSGIITNILMWCIPAARRAFADEAQSMPEIGFQTSMRQLTRLLLWSLLIAVPLSLLGAATLP